MEEDSTTANQIYLRIKEPEPEPSPSPTYILLTCGFHRVLHGGEIEKQRRENRAKEKEMKRG